MVLEAYSASRPSLPYRGPLAAAFLLLLTIVLALGLASVRTAGEFTEAIHPPGWDITFRIPIGFDAEPHETRSDAVVYRFRHKPSEVEAIELAAWRMDARGGKSARSVGERILDGGDVLGLRALFGQSPARSVQPLGGREAVESVDLSTPMIVRALVLDNGWAYAVSLRLEGGSMDENAYHLFDAVCRSVELRPAFRQGSQLRAPVTPPG